VFTLIIVALGISLGFVIFAMVDNHNNDTTGAIENTTAQTSHTPLEHAISTCQYGSAMFYVARDIDPEEAKTLATSDCASYLADNGEEWFTEYYGIQE
jgi:hypothetical protein